MRAIASPAGFANAAFPLDEHGIMGAWVLSGLREYWQTNAALLERYLQQLRIWQGELAERLVVVLGEARGDDLQAIIARYTRYVERFRG